MAAVNISPEIISLIDEIKGDKTHGASQLARQVHEHTGQTIAWHTFGINGIRLGALVGELETAELPAADVVLLSMGVNDTTGFTPRYHFRRQLRELRQLLEPRYQGGSAASQRAAHASVYGAAITASVRDGVEGPAAG